MLGALSLGATAFIGRLREDELECEQAAAVLDECCPNFSPQGLNCSYSTGCGSTTYPTLSIGESQCIQEMSCETLVAKGVCDRAAIAEPPIIPDDGGAPQPRQEVCP